MTSLAGVLLSYVALTSPTQEICAQAGAMCEGPVVVVVDDDGVLATPIQVDCPAREVGDGFGACDLPVIVDGWYRASRTTDGERTPSSMAPQQRARRTRRTLVTLDRAPDRAPVLDVGAAQPVALYFAEPQLVPPAPRGLEAPDAIPPLTRTLEPPDRPPRA